MKRAWGAGVYRRCSRARSGAGVPASAAQPHPIAPRPAPPRLGPPTPAHLHARRIVCRPKQPQRRLEQLALQLLVRGQHHGGGAHSAQDEGQHRAVRQRAWGGRGRGRSAGAGRSRGEVRCTVLQSRGCDAQTRVMHKHNRAKMCMQTCVGCMVRQNVRGHNSEHLPPPRGRAVLPGIGLRCLL